MNVFRRFLFMLFSFCILLLPVYAAEDPSLYEPGYDGVSSSTVSSSDSDVSVSALEGLLSDLPSYSEESPLPVQIVPEDNSFPDLAFNSDFPEVVIDDEPPSNPAFYGAAWVTGTDSRLGTVTIYFPIDTQSCTWGLDSNGYLFNVSDSSYSGYLAGVYNNGISAGGFSYPRYRDSDGSSWDYYDLHLIPQSSNIQIATDNVPLYPASHVMPYVILLCLGVIVICLFRR